jgi:hypothetical protein
MTPSTRKAIVNIHAQAVDMLDEYAGMLGHLRDAARTGKNKHDPAARESLLKAMQFSHDLRICFAHIDDAILTIRKAIQASPSISK